MATDQSDSSGLGVPPLENTAFFAIEADDEYVRHTGRYTGEADKRPPRGEFRLAG